MDIRNLLENIDTRKVIAGMSVIILLGLMLVVLFGGDKKAGVDTVPFEGSSQDYSLRARIIGGEELFKLVAGGKRYDSLSEDLYVFGSTAYEEYKKDDVEVIGFTLSSEVKKESDTVTFSGEFGSSSNTVTVSLELLKNSRLKSSITDTKTKLNIDQKLPSNSKFNSYIAKLPIIGDGYTAGYSASDGKISIQLDDRDPALSQRAFDDIQKEVDDGSYDSKQIQIIFPPPGGV